MLLNQVRTASLPLLIKVFNGWALAPYALPVRVIEATRENMAIKVNT